MKGQEFGNYVVREKIGEGGMGEVFLAEHRRMGRKAAIKVLRTPSSADAHDVERFFNEARAASIIDHPGVVQIFDCDFHEKRAYLIMEYIEGESLAAMIRRIKSLAAAPESLRSIGTQIANVLAAAHAKGIVHRDLKPDNVFLESKLGGSAPFLVRILDFGIAKLVAADVPGLTKTGTVLGTPTYMAPEQCAGDRDVDTRADIYSLGCMLFEMAVGAPPFVRAGTGSLITAHMSEPPPSVDEAWPSAPAGFVSLVAQMLAKDPSRRPQTMGEVESWLQQSLSLPVRGSALPASPTGGPPVTATVSLATQKQPAIETQIDPRGLMESPTAMSSGSEDSFPGLTVSLPTGKRPPTGNRPSGVFSASFNGRLRSLAHKIHRKHLSLLVVAVVAIGLAMGLATARRKTTSPASSRGRAMPVQIAAPAPAVTEVSAPAPAVTTQAVPVPQEATSSPLQKDSAAATEENRRRGTSTDRTKTRSVSRRRTDSRAQPKKEIRGFTDF